MRTIGIAIAGASGSGKTTLAEALAGRLGGTLLRIDDYYRPFDHLTFEERGETNFDHPDSIDDALLCRHVRSLLAGEPVEVPRYDFTRHTRFPVPARVEPASILIVEGLFALGYAELREQCAVRVFVDTPDDVCLERRIHRDVTERGRTPGEVVSRFHGHVWPMYRRHVYPTRAEATVCVGGIDPVDDSVARVLSALRLSFA